MSVSGRSAAARSCLVAASVVAFGLATTAVASAQAPGPHWDVITQPAPTYFHPGDTSDFYEVIAVNDGGAATAGEIAVTDTLPTGLVATAVNASAEQPEETKGGGGTPMTCPVAPVSGSVTCTAATSVPVGRIVVLKINVEVPLTAAGVLVSSATIAGGGAAPATATSATPVRNPAEAVPYGLSVASDLVAASGSIEAQAGSHPFGFTTLLAFNVGSVTQPSVACETGSVLTPSCAEPDAETKDLEVALPRGLVGNPTVLPHCGQAAFHSNSFRGCPADTQVGGMYLFFYGSGTHVQYAPVYDVEPPPGQPAELGFSVSLFAHVPMYFHVRSDGDYGLTADISNISEQDPVRAVALMIWGVPAAEAHNEMRESQENCDPVLGCQSGVVPKPFLTLPTDCGGGSLTMPFASDSWQQPEAQLATLATAELADMTGCEALLFSPLIAAAATSNQVGAPAGYDIALDVPQDEEPEGFATPAVRDAEVTMPAGTVVSPSAANGLLACDEAQFGLRSRAPGQCPRESKIGTVTIATPLLEQPLTGSMYVGEPECVPCGVPQSEAGQMVRVLLEVSGSGVIIKLAGHVRIDGTTGRVTAVFEEDPELPFTDLRVVLEDGQSAPLRNPSICGPAVTTANLTPWSATAPADIVAPPIPISGCSTPLFAPSLRAGTTATAQAGAFSPFSVTLSRPDGQQDLGSVTMSMPPGLLGMLSNVSLCGEAEANAGTCPASSQIGSTSTTLGPGTLPLTIGGGKVYLTGPYKGRPFGLSIVVPAEAGPFRLAGNTGNGTEVVRASIAVNPYTSALTITSDALPQQLNGIPLDIRAIQVDVDRPGFIFNPTDCDAMAIGGTVTSATGTVASVSFPFQAVNCATLPFHPSFAALTQSKTSKANGASLHVRVTSTPGQANIAKVRTSLPKQLPSRLTTLQKACLAAVFEANPSSCPAASNVGTATAMTPVLKAPLTGPAYLVSHGGAAFPDLEIVLQGEGITLILDGNTNIKNGITTSTFNALPDAPISSFDLVLPTGSHSVLGAALPRKARNSLCGEKLTMPTMLTGQNGAVVTQATKIGVSGCPKHHRAKAKKRHRHPKPTRRK